VYFIARHLEECRASRRIGRNDRRDDMSATLSQCSRDQSNRRAAISSKRETTSTPRTRSLGLRGNSTGNRTRCYGLSSKSQPCGKQVPKARAARTDNARLFPCSSRDRDVRLIVFVGAPAKNFARKRQVCARPRTTVSALTDIAGRSWAEMVAIAAEIARTVTTSSQNQEADP